MGCQASMQTKEDLMNKFNKDFCKYSLASSGIPAERLIVTFEHLQ